MRHAAIGGAILFALALVLGAFPVQAAPACPEAQQFDHAKETAVASAEKGTFTNVTIMETTAEVDTFLATINGTYGRDIPLGKADHAIAIVVPDGPNAGIMAFGYRDGCQVGFLIVRRPPDATSGEPDAPPLRRYDI